MFGLLLTLKTGKTQTHIPKLRICQLNGHGFIIFLWVIQNINLRGGTITIDDGVDVKDITITPLENGFRTNFSNYSHYQIATKKTSGNLFIENSINPYYCALIRFSQTNVDLDSLSSITIDFSKSRDFNTAIVFDEVVPEPSDIQVNKITFTGKETIEKILKNGEILIDAKDTVRAYRADRLYLLFSVLIGTMIAFCIDIIIKLIYKWRKIKLEITYNSNN